ncbi:TPA: hypothetical protein P0E14_003948 [Vibrio harveyi]|nr:hypothetical protein [Vibrio harveyi]
MKYLIGLFFPFIGFIVGSLAIPLGIVLGVASYVILSRAQTSNSFETKNVLNEQSSQDPNLLSNKYNVFDSDSLDISSPGSPSSIDDDLTINPASGLPMIGGIGGLDAEGNPYGMDSSDSLLSSSTFKDSTSSCFDDSNLFDDNFGCGSSSFDDPFS